MQLTLKVQRKETDSPIDELCGAYSIQLPTRDADREYDALEDLLEQTLPSDCFDRAQVHMRNLYTHLKYAAFRTGFQVAVKLREECRDEW